MFISIIKEGINTVHKNWQLVLIQLAVMVISCISFFLIVGIPIAVAFIIFGLDLTEILRLTDISSIFKGSADLLKKYFGIAVIILLSIVIYLAFITVMWLFTLSGTIGILKNSILNEKDRFTFKAFWTEGKHFFFPVLLFSALIGIIAIAVAFMLGILGGVASNIIELAKTQEATLALFLGVFFSLVLLSAGLFLIIITLSITVYGVANIAFTRKSPVIAFKQTINYIYSIPSSIIFYGILLMGYILSGFIVIFIGSPLTLIPIIGPILSMPYQLISYVIQGYIGLIMLSSVFWYYYRTGYSLSHEESTHHYHTSHGLEREQSPAPEQREDYPQA